MKSFTNIPSPVISVEYSLYTRTVDFIESACWENPQKSISHFENTRPAFGNHKYETIFILGPLPGIFFTPRDKLLTIQLCERELKKQFVHRSN